MDNKFYICSNNIGISHFDLSNDSMSSIRATKDKNKWLEFSYEEAISVKDMIGWDILTEKEKKMVSINV